MHTRRLILSHMKTDWLSRDKTEHARHRLTHYHTRLRHDQGANKAAYTRLSRRGNWIVIQPPAAVCLIAWLLVCSVFFVVRLVVCLIDWLIVRLFDCLFVWLFVCLIACSFVWLLAWLFVVCPFDWLFACLFDCLIVWLFVCLICCLFDRLFDWVFVWLFVFPFDCLLVHWIARLRHGQPARKLGGHSTACSAWSA